MQQNIAEQGLLRSQRYRKIGIRVKKCKEGTRTVKQEYIIQKKEGVSMEKIQNFIRINGEYIPQEDIPEEQLKEIGRELIIRMAGALGYVPVEEPMKGRNNETT